MPDSFQTTSVKIAKDFLHTAVIIDDKFFIPETRKPAKMDGPPKGRQALHETGAQNARNTENGIDAEKLINSFAAQGIICATLKYQKIGFQDKFALTAKRADIAIIDWQLEDKTGKKALLLMSNLLSEDLKEPAQHRLITIYTGTNTLDDIVLETQRHIRKKFKISFDLLQDGLTLRYKSITITVLAKESTKVIDGYKSAVLDENGVPERLIQLFSESISGLLPNAILTAISAIRTNTNTLLHSYRRELDPAFVSHRAMLPNPDDAGEQLTASIAGSLHATLSYTDLAETVNAENIASWLKAQTFDPLDIKMKDKTLIIGDNERIIWQQKGYAALIEELYNANNDEKIDKSATKNHDIKTRAMAGFLPKGVAAEGLHEEFSILTHHKSNVNAPAYIPQLTLGTIVRKGIKTPEYFLCIQQRCDSLRLADGEKRNFLFLPLLKVDASKKVDVVVKLNDGGYDLLACPTKPCHVLKLIPFMASKGADLVRASGSKRRGFFFSRGKIRYYWVLDLKESHAQRIANNYSADLSRVGLDESEWLRLKSK